MSPRPWRERVRGLRAETGMELKLTNPARIDYVHWKEKMISGDAMDPFNRGHVGKSKACIFMKAQDAFDFLRWLKDDSPLDQPTKLVIKANNVAAWDLKKNERLTEESVKLLPDVSSTKDGRGELQGYLVHVWNEQIAVLNSPPPDEPLKLGAKH